MPNSPKNREIDPWLRSRSLQQIDMPVATYPEFAGIPLPLGSVTPIK